MILEGDSYYGHDTIVAAACLPDRRELQLWRYLFNYRLYVGDGPQPMTYEDVWCFATLEAGMKAMAEWDGEGEPSGWIKHPGSGRFRPGGDASREYNQARPAPHG